MKTLTDTQYEALEEAYASLMKMATATVDNADGKDQCSCFHTEPFQTHWDQQTVKEVRERVLLFLNSWVVTKLSVALDVSTKKRKAELLAELESLKAKKEAVQAELDELHTSPGN